MFLSLTKHHTMKTYWVVEVELNAFSKLTLDGGEWTVYSLATLPCGKRPRYPLERRPGEARQPVWTQFRREKFPSFPLAWMESRSSIP